MVEYGYPVSLTLKGTMSQTIDVQAVVAHLATLESPFTLKDAGLSFYQAKKLQDNHYIEARKATRKGEGRGRPAKTYGLSIKSRRLVKNMAQAHNQAPEPEDIAA